MNIDIAFAYPGNNLVNPPRVTDPETRVDSVAAAETQVTWRPTGSTPAPSAAGLRIVGIDFFATPADKAAGTASRPSVMKPGRANADGSFTVDLDTAVAVPTELSLSYNLRFTDVARSIIGQELTWDPTIKIKPRAAAGSPSETSAGAG